MDEPLVVPFSVRWLLPLALVITALGSSSRCATAQPLEVEPFWRAAGTGATADAAIGDFDLDGDLDLVVADFTPGPAVYWNVGGTKALTRTPTRLEPPSSKVVCTVVGDLDGDGDLDLVFGTEIGRNVIYRNDGGTFGSPIEFGLSGYSLDAACADVDLDGDLDLVFGNLDAANVLYRNDAGVLGVLGDDFLEFDSDTTVTRGIAVGELDGDPGSLEIVCGNDSRPNRIFRFDEETGLSLWLEIAPGSRTATIGLADIEADGSLDIVAVNEDQNFSVHFNEGLEFTRSIAFDTPHAVFGLAIGDVNRDGWPDILLGGSDNDPAALYLNDFGTFNVFTPPDWTSGSEGGAFSLSLADLDADGDPDLVHGILGVNAGTVMAFRNLAAWLAHSGRELGARKRNWTVEIEDLDLDGDLDVVTGGDGWEIGLNQGDGSIMFVAGGEEAVRGIGIDDLDGDGDPDLVLANEQEPNAVYRNDLTDGVPVFTHVWSSPEANRSSSVAVDPGSVATLVFGNGSSVTPEPNAEFHSTDGGITFLQSLWNPPANLTNAVVFADLDLDGDKDLVCGNGFDFGFGTWNTLYARASEDDGDTLTATPLLWGREEPTRALAVGDIDGDGLQDLVTGNDAQNTWVRNTGSLEAFATSEPAAIGTSGGTYALALGDVDADGDLDVASGSGGPGSGVADLIHANDGSQFTQAWSSQEYWRTLSVAFGDLDRDGDLDLVTVGWDADQIYLGSRSPAFRFAPEEPFAHLPNNGAIIRSVTVGRDEGTNMALVSLTVVDPESDSLWLVPEYQYTGDPAWYRAAIEGGASPAGPLATSPQGIQHQFTWDLLPLSFDERDVVLRLRGVSIPSRISEIQHVASYQLVLGSPIQPLRAEVSPGASSVTFEPVTWGDTVSQSLEVHNTGNLPLELQRIDGPPALTAEEFNASNVPAVLQPGARTSLELSVAPVASSPSGTSFLTLVSDDPLQPAITIEAELQVYPLTVTTRILSPTPVAPLGADLSVLVTPVAPEAEIDRVDLWYRSPGEARFSFTRLPLTRSSETVHDYLGVIPRADVTEAGLEFYTQVVNGSVSVTDPPGAPDSVYNVTVQSPITLGSWFSEPSQGNLAGDSIGVAALLPEGSVFVEGTLFHREVGKTEFSAVLLVALDPPSEIRGLKGVAFGIIPATAVGNRGVQYRIQVQTLGGGAPLFDPPGDAESTHSIAVQVLDLRDPRGERLGGVYDEISVPLLPSVSVTESLNDDLGPLDVSRWRFFKAAAGTAQYEELTESNREGISFEPGRAYWLIHRDAATIGSGRGVSTPTGDGGRVIHLERGLNLVGNPFAFPVAWSELSIDSTPWASALDSLVEIPRTWDPERGDYVSAGPLMEPWEGYWIRNLSDQRELLFVPPVEASSAGVESAAAGGGPEGTAIRIEVYQDGQRGSSAKAFLLPNAVAQWDGHDLSALPLPPGGGLQVYFPRASWDRHPGRYSVDARNPGLAHNEWTFDVAIDTEDPRRVREVTLTLNGLDTIPESLTVLLVDRELNRVMDVRESSEYTFLSGGRGYREEDEARFRLIVDLDGSGMTPDSPSVTRLLQSYPNPFRGTTAIRYELAEPGQVRLEIYDVQGRLVWRAERDHSAPGRFEVPWDGTGRTGRVSPGLYFYRLVTPTLVETRKLHRIG